MSSPSTRLRRWQVSAAAAALAVPLVVALPAQASTTRNEVVYASDEDNDGAYSIVLRDLESDTSRTVVPADAATQTLYDDPELSPTGDRIAFSTDRGSVEFDEAIAVVNRNGSGFRRLTTPPAATETPTQSTYTVDIAPAWSPDGSRLLFTRVRTVAAPDGSPIDVTSALYTVPAAGGGATPVPNATNGYTADWSPDGTRIVFAALPPDGEDGAITVVSWPSGAGARVIAGATGMFPAWSPDGSTIAFARVTDRDPDRDRAHDVTQIATVPAAGGTVRTLAATRPSSARTVAGYPSWAPDGESLVYDLWPYSATDDFPPGDVWAVDLAGRRAARLAGGRGDQAQPHAQGPRPVDVSAGLRSTFTPVTPERILDTRAGLGAPKRQVGPRGVVDLAVRGLPTQPTAVPQSATAVVLNVTLTEPTGPTTVTAYPSGTAVPLASNLNASAAGTTVPNLVTVRIGTNGAVSLRNAFGSAHLIADIAGYYTSDEGGQGFAALEPSRVLDTRAGLGAPDAPVGPGRTTDLRVTGTLTTADGGRTVTVPSTARAVVLNVTGTGPTAVRTDVRVYPTPSGSAPAPLVSNLNLSKGQTAANLVTVLVGDGGRVRLRNNSGTVELVADLAGYYAEGAPGRFVPVSPTRFLDTRSGTGTAPLPATAGALVDVRVAGRRAVPASATLAVLNLTATRVSGTASTDVRAFASTASRVPTVSNLNIGAGDTRANLAFVPVGTDGAVRLRNASGRLDLIADLAGYMVG